MLPDRVSNPGPLTYESGALPIALCGPAAQYITTYNLITQLKKIRAKADILQKSSPEHQ